MSTGFWVAEGASLLNTGWAFSHFYLRYRGVQALLWPVTLAVRACHGDPLRDPAPLKLMSPEEIRALEAEVGVGEAAEEKAAHKALDAAHRRYQAAGGREAKEELEGRLRAYERLQGSGRSRATAGNTEEIDWQQQYRGLQ